jgi:excisionase family DNA binding protein
VKKRRTAITIETQRILLISSPRGSLVAWCPRCAAVVRMIAPDEAAVLIRVSSRTIYRWVEARRLHFSETSKGMLFICFNSLMQAANEGERPCEE